MKPTDVSPENTQILYSIDELAQQAGVTRRTVRYYISRGLLPPPEGLGRGRHYTQRHLFRLLEIRNRQMAGESLDAIEAGENATQLSDSPAHPSWAVWTRLQVADGVELHLRGVLLDPEKARRLQVGLLQLLAQENLLR